MKFSIFGAYKCPFCTSARKTEDVEGFVRTVTYECGTILYVERIGVRYSPKWVEVCGEKNGSGDKKDNPKRNSSSLARGKK